MATSQDMMRDWNRNEVIEDSRSTLRQAERLLGWLVPEDEEGTGDRFDSPVLEARSEMEEAVRALDRALEVLWSLTPPPGSRATLGTSP